MQPQSSSFPPKLARKIPPGWPAPAKKPPNAKPQLGAIIARLTNARGEWVTLPEITACVAQYNAPNQNPRFSGVRP
jgi:hypothetical protein